MITRYVTYKRVEGVAVGRDRGDKDCRPRDRGRKPVERGPDDAQAGTVENRIGPAIRKRRQSRYVCWYPRVSQSCTTREFLLVFSRVWIVPKKNSRFLVLRSFLFYRPSITLSMPLSADEKRKKGRRLPLCFC